MASPASVARHPIHPMLVPFPIGLLVFSLVADIVYLATGSAVWAPIAFWTMAGGLIGALCAAIPGLIDFLSLRDRRARRLATIHLTLNLTVVAMFAVDLWLRTQPAAADLIPFWISVAAVVLLAVSGWLGGELVYVLGVAVEPAARGRETEIRTERRDVSRSA